MSQQQSRGGGRGQPRGGGAGGGGQSGGAGRGRGSDRGGGRGGGGYSQQGGGGYSQQGGGGYSQQGGGGYSQQGDNRPPGQGGGGYQDRGGRGGGGFQDRGGNRGGGGYQDRGGRGGGFQDRGGPRGGGGGGFRGGRGAATLPSWIPSVDQNGKSTRPFGYEAKNLGRIDQIVGGTGWHSFPYNDKKDVELQEYKGPPATICEKFITVSVNHYRLENFSLPQKIYHYEVEMERIKRAPGVDKPQAGTTSQTGKSSPKKGGPKRDSPPVPSGQGQAQGQQPKRLPKPLPQLVLTLVLAKIRRDLKRHAIVSDLSNNIYSAFQLEGKISLDQIVSMTDVDQEILQETDDGQIKVTIIPTELQIDTTGMNEYLRSHNNWRGFKMDVGTKTPLEQMYNAIVKSMPRFKFIPVGRNLARWPNEGEHGGYLGSNVTCWKGISAHISMGWNPYLCVDLAHCAFNNDISVLDALEDKFGPLNRDDVQRWDERTFKEAKSFLRNIKISYQLGKGMKRGAAITDLMDYSPSEITFDWENKGKISVTDYFWQKYKVKLNHPNGLCLELRKKDSVPAELCVIKKGQSFSRKLDGVQTQNMLKLAKKDPFFLQQEINQNIKEMKTDQNQVLQEWGVHVANNMLELSKTRVLPAPMLRFGAGVGNNAGKDAIIQPINGEWEIWNSKYNFFEQKSVGKFGILAVGQCRLTEANLWTFFEILRENSAIKGVNFTDENPIIKIDDRMRDFDEEREKNVRTLVNLFKQNFEGCQLVLVAIPKKGSPLYSHVKQAAELNVGILTQCVVAANISSPRFPDPKPATVQNILLKINAKLGGVNHVIAIPPPTKTQLKNIDLFTCPMLIIGADVTHPPPAASTSKVKDKNGVEMKIPSFAAVTGSIDKTGMPFMMDIRAQEKAGKGAAEVIQGLTEIVLKMLKTFEDKTRGIRPRKIIYFRDGVGEGQFPEVLHTEMLGIRRACEQLQDYDGNAYQPKITFVTVQKRHKTRIFCHTERGETVNPPPGTIVDTEIVHQTETDFYLCSHKGMMGTSRPTRYHVLWDDSNFTADEIQNLTYYLCYMYVRCNKSVKIPAPTYYAHWAAARAKVLTEGMDQYYGNLADLNRMMQRNTSFTEKFPMHFV